MRNKSKIGVFCLREIGKRKKYIFEMEFHG